MKRIFTSAILSLFLIGTSYAQSNVNATVLDSAIVLSKRIDIPLNKQNRTITIITSEDIKKYPNNNINELLQKVAGIDIRQRGPQGTQADINVNGGSFDQTLVLLNGIKMSDVQTGHNMMNIPVDVSAIERIEILKGAAASIYGINAMNGVINIVTKKKKENVINGNISIGSNFKQQDSTNSTYYNINANAFASLNAKTINHNIAIGYNNGNGYRYNTAFTNYKLYYNSNIELPKNMSTLLQAGYINNNFGANSFYAAPFDKYAREKTEVFIASISTKIPINTYWTTTPSVHYRYGTDNYVFNHFNPSLYENNHYTNAIDFNWDNQILIKKHRIGWGIVNRYENINSNNLGKRNRNNIGGFFNFRSNIGDDFEYTIGAFINHNSVFKKKVYPSIDLGYDMKKYGRIFANVGTGQRIPTFTDLYYSDRANVGNELLIPELAITYELGYKNQWRNGSVLISTFYRNATDYIDWFRADTVSKWKPYNLATVNTFGINVEALQTIYNQDNHNLLYRLGYTYLLPQYQKSINTTVNNQFSKYIINSLSHQLINAIDYNYANKLSIGIIHRYAKRLNSPNTNDGYRRSDYSLLDARIAYKVKGVAIFCDIRNMLDVKYIESGVVPLPGRWMSIGVTF